MATVLSTSGNNPQDKVDFFINAAFEEHGMSRYRWRESLRSETIPMGESANIKFVRVPRIVLPGELAEGVTPASDDMDKEIVTATAKQYGQVVELSDVSELILKHPLSQRAMIELAEAAARKDDQLIQDVALGASSVLYGAGKASRGALASGDVVDTDLLRDTVALLDVGSDGVDGGAKRMSGGLYKGIFHTKHMLDLMGDTDFRNTAYRQDAEALRRGIFNRWAGVEFVESNFGPHFTNLGASEGAVGVTITAVDGGGSLDSSTSYDFVITRKHRKRGFEEGVSAVLSKVSAATGNNESFTVDLPSDTNYTYSVYFDDSQAGGGSARLVAADQAAGSTVTITAIAAAAAALPPAAPASGVTVYTSYVMGAESMAVVDLKKLETFTRKGHDSGDPLAQRMQFGTKWFSTAVILNDAWIVRLEAPSNH